MFIQSHILEQRFSTTPKVASPEKPYLSGYMHALKQSYALRQLEVWSDARTGINAMRTGNTIDTISANFMQDARDLPPSGKERKKKKKSRGLE